MLPFIIDPYFLVSKMNFINEKPPYTQNVYQGGSRSAFLIDPSKGALGLLENKAYLFHFPKFVILVYHSSKVLELL